MYYLSVNIWVRAYYFYGPRNQTTSCQYKLSKKLVQRIIGTIGLVVLESKQNIGTCVSSQNKISVLVRVRVL